MSPIPTNNELRSSLIKWLQQARSATESFFESLNHIYIVLPSVEA